MAYTINRRLSTLVDSNGQLNTGKISNDYITGDHIADNVITAAMLHTSFTVSTSNLTSIDTDDVSEGSSNLYYTDARARGAVSATGSISYNSSTGVFSFTQGDTDTISEGSTNLYFTNERVDDRVNTLLTAGTGITLTYDDGANTLTIAGAAQYGDSDVESYLDTNGLTLPDNVKAQFGASNDLEIYHVGDSSNYVSASSGNLILQNETDNQDILIKADDGSGGLANYIQADGSTGEVRLYHYGSEKLNTTSTGVDVTGAVVATSFSDGTISGITFIDEDSFTTNSATRVPTQQSIKAYVDTQVAGVVDSAPAALDTLNELAAALGDDANFSTTTSTALGNRLRVDTAAQGLTGTQQANAITNLGITATKAELNYVDGVTSNIQTQLNGKQASGSYLTTSTSFGGDVSGTYNAIVIANDSHTHTFDNLTGKQAGTGDYSTTGALVAGRGSGSIAMTINDGYGNSNLTFNHQGGTPDQNGNAARIEVNTDASTNASMNFEIKSGVTGGTPAGLTTVLNLAEGVAAVTGNITVSGTVDGRDIATDGTKLDGIAANANNYSFPYTVSVSAGNNTVVQRHSSGYIYANYFNGTGTFNTTGNTSGMALFTGTNGTDTFGRSYTAAAARALLNVENGATADQTITLSGDASGSGTTSIAVTVADNSHNHSSSSGDFTINGGNLYTGTGQQRVKVGVWSNTTYGIGMQAGYTFGGITNEYVLTNQMSNTNGRGFWWGDSGHTNAQGAMALTTQGYLTVANRIRVGYGESDTTTPSKDLDVSGEASIGSLMVGATTTPAMQLQVKDTTNYHGILVNGSNAPNVCFDRSTGTTPEWKVGVSGNTGTSFAISKGTANDDKLTIDSAGNVGIGVTPLTKFHVRVATNANFLVQSALSSTALKILDNAGSTYTAGTINAGSLSINADSGGQTLINTTDGNMPTAGGNAPCVIYGGAGNGFAYNALHVGGGRISLNAQPNSNSTRGYLECSGAGFKIWHVDNSDMIFGANNSEKMRIQQADGRIRSQPTYDNAAPATHRDVYVENSGQLGYASSVRAHKTNINSYGDASWLYQIDPKTFNYRKPNTTTFTNGEGHTEEVRDGTYSDTEYYDNVEVGLIAEDVEAHDPNLCFYNVKEDEDGNVTNELAGIHYKAMVVPMLKLIQELKAENDALKARLDAGGL